MEILERIWEFLGLFFGGVLRFVERSITAVMGSANARYVKKLQGRVAAINALEPQMTALSNEELKDQTRKFRERLAKGESLDDLLVEAFATCREAGRRFLSMRHYDVQLIGGMVLHSGSIAEMVTGEGKTLVATLPAYLNALAGKGVHVVTVNDYLARRDMEWMAPLYMGLGLTIGAIQNDMKVLERQRAYDCDITYGTNNEFGFDYLRDNMRPAARRDDRFPKEYQQSQGGLHFAIIDEVDNILIDEARTPLIISGPAHDDVKKYAEADRIARQLRKEEHFIVNEKDHTASLTDEGVRVAERLAGVESFYTAGNMEWPHLIDNSLKAHHLYKRDVNYVVKEGRVVIVDEFTGRLMEGRQWSDGLHQSVEAKEGVKIKEETQTLATITLQNFFKLYDKICGMTGTAMTEANEFWKIYKLDVVAIPTNRDMQRKEFPDVIFCTEGEKYTAVADDIERCHKWDVLVFKNGDEEWGTVVKEDDSQVVFQSQGKRDRVTYPREKIASIEYKGRPVLVGTVSIEKSERISSLLEKRGIPHQVLNAKHHRREAEIVAQAGRLGAVTIATNMAGRGTDIILGGNPETMAWARLQDKYATRLDVPQEEWTALVGEIEAAEKMKEEGRRVKTIGGLYVVGTERHDARRIDLQLRGRCGRQGDPGSSRFYLSLEDDLMRIFAGEWVKNILSRLGMKDGESIESPMVTRRIEGAQKKREEHNFEVRKNLLEYDEVMDEQRKRVYGYRQRILNGVNCRRLIVDAIAAQTSENMAAFLDRDFGVESFARWAGQRLGAQLQPRDFRGMELGSADRFAKDEAERAAETQIFEAIEENLPDGEDESEWNWEALASFCNARWGLNLRDRDLKRTARGDLSEFLLEKAAEAINRVELSDGAPMLEEDYGLRTAAAWAHSKFGLQLDPKELQGKDISEAKRLVRSRAEATYDDKEAIYPVMAGLYRFSQVTGPGTYRLDREGLVAWAQQRFETQLNLDALKNKQREEIQAVLVERSKKHLESAQQKLKVVHDKVTGMFRGHEEGRTVVDVASGNGALDSLTEWIQSHLHAEIPGGEISNLNQEEFEQRLSNAVEDHYRPEIRRMERMVLLQIVDTAWKDHLLAMDHLRSAIGLVGYAQLDAKVEYKREGMRLFDEMWKSINERVTDLVFRMENLNEDFVGSTWVETSARKDQAPASSDIARQQDDAIRASQGDVVIETIRHRGERVGRNEPCPCGSGKKYKSCCMRRDQVA